jgi:hypothetical protein
MTTTIYVITSIMPSGGSGNFDYTLETATPYTGTFTDNTGGISDKDDIFETGEVYYYTVNGTVYEATYDGFADINAVSDSDFGVFTITGIVSGPDTDGLLGLQFGFTTDGSVPSATARGKALDPAIGTEIPGLVCFSAGTMIDTAFGPVAVERLKIGDLVMTRDDGYQQIRWTNARAARLRVGTVQPNTPVRIRANAFGRGTPNCDLIVSQQHRIMVDGPVAQLLFGEPEVLAAAKHLVNGANVDFATDLAVVNYVHFMFDRHQIVLANSLTSESFYPDREALRATGQAARQKLLKVFPEVRANARAYGPTARLTIKAHQASVFMDLYASGHKVPAIA